MMQHYSLNAHGRDFVVGDIHGCYNLLRTALSRVGFEQDRDRLFSVGDLVDRGPESEYVLEWLAQPWFHPVRGNHEDMVIRWLKSHPADRARDAFYRTNGGGWFIDLGNRQQEKIVRAFEKLPIAIEVETRSGTVGIVHADCPASSWAGFMALLDSASLDVRNAALHLALWNRDRYREDRQARIEDRRAVIVGHTPTDNVVALGYIYYIDTYGWANGRFTLMDLEKLRA